MSDESAGVRGAGRRRWRNLAIAIVALAATLAFVLGGAKTSSYVKNDGRLCTSSCHTVASKLHRDVAGHEDLACQTCHPTDFRTGVSLLVRSVRGHVEGAPRHSQDDAAACVACHQKNVVEWQAVKETAGHHEHAAGRKPVGCAACHGKQIHGNKPVDEICRECHNAGKLHKHRDDGDDCQSCHNFKAKSQRAAGLTLNQCDGCHGAAAKQADPEGPKTKNASLVTPDLLHGKVNCKLCHQPHNERGGVGRQQCNLCHEIQIGTEASPAPEGHRVCVRCHSPHAPLTAAAVTCAKCHEQAKKRATGPSSTALRHDSCASCHVPHRWLPERSGCLRCHSDNAQKILTRSPEKHQKCTACHEVHGPPPSGNTCVGCHKPRVKHVAVAPAKHKNCASCHDPHAAKDLDVPRMACPRCHTGQVEQLMREGPADHGKVGCLGCHPPHDRPLPDIKKACSRCHSDKIKATNAPQAPAPHKICSSCHQPHRFKIFSQNVACGRCHQNVANDPGNHPGLCTKCHNQHGAPQVQKAACLKCHETINLKPPPGNQQHANCGSCHKPHQLAKNAISQCKVCHADKAQIAKLWPASSPHAGECNKCHSQHEVLKIEACGTCHTKQSAGAGKHKCVNCHSPHKAPAAQKSEWWNRCQSCHTQQAADIKLGGHNQPCSKCHEEHKFARPKCTSCHGTIVQQAAHGVKEHQNCTKCHGEHTTSKPGRAECLACHRDRQSHQPDAKRCNACHPFKS
jgi:hypothetical protein